MVLEDSVASKHICELDDSKPITGNGDSCFNKRILKYLLISYTNPLTKFFFRSNVAVEKERVRQQKKYKVIIHPYSSFRLYYELVFVGLFFVDILSSPYFSIKNPNVNYLVFRELSVTSVRNGDLAIAFINIIDFTITFCTGRVIKTRKKVVLSMQGIAQNYIKSTEFYFDLYCCLPHFLKFYGCYTLFPTLLRNLKYETRLVINIFILLKIFRLRKFKLYFNNVALNFRHYYYYLIIVKYIFLIIITIIYLAAIHYLIGEFLTFMYPIHSHSYKTRNVYELPILQAYTILVYQVSSQLLGISLVNGHRESIYFLSQKSEEIFFFIINALIGFVGTNVMLIHMVQLIFSMNSTEIKYYAIISQVKEYMSHQNLPAPMQKRILEYYEYRFQKKYFREASIMTMLSETLRREINMHSCRTLIENVSLLRELPNDVLAEIVVNLKREVFLHNDYIFKAGQTGDCMYFISKGTVAIFTKSGKELCHLQDGAYFGEVALVTKNKLRVADVVAIEICEMYRLDRSHFRSCFTTSSLYYKKIEQIAQERMEKTALLEELHRKYILENKTKRLAEQTALSIKKELDF